MSYTDPATHVAGDTFPSSDWNTYVRDNFRFLHDQGGDLVAAATITPTTQFHKVTGNTGIGAVTALAAGARLWLWFTGTPILTHTASGGATGTLVLQGGANYQVVAQDVLEFVSDGTQWRQVGAKLTSGLSYLSATLGADVTMTTAGTFYDGPSVTLTVGTWDLDAVVAAKEAAGIGTDSYYGKLWNGTTTVCAAEETVAIGKTQAMPFTGVVVVASGTETWRVSMTSSRNGNKIGAAISANSPGNFAALLEAVKIA